MVTTLLTELAPAPSAHQQQELAISLNKQLKETPTTPYIMLEKLSHQTLHMKLKKCSTSPHTKLQKAPPASPLIMLLMLHIPTYHIKQKQEQLVRVFLLPHIVIARRFFLNLLLLFSPT